MVAKPRTLLTMGNHHVTGGGALKQALPANPSTKKKRASETLGILSFEAANAMSKIVHLHRSLSDPQIHALKTQILKSDGVRALVSADESRLLALALHEKLDDLNRAAAVVSRLGRKCTVPALLGFEHVYGDIVAGAIDIKELAFLVKDMDGMVRKMERYVASTAALYSEMEVMNELEAATRKFQHDESRKAFEQKLAWQKQDVRHLKDVSLWNRSYDKVVGLMARTVCTIYARIVTVFGDGGGGDPSVVSRSQHAGFSASFRRVAGRKTKKDVGSRNSTKTEFQETVVGGSFRPGGHLGVACCNVPGRVFMECLSLNNSGSKVDYDDDHISYDGESSRISGVLSVSSSVINREHNTGLSGFLNRERPSKGDLMNCSKLGPKGQLQGNASPSSVGGSGLALHYANIIVVLEKFLKYPHLVGDEAREDLYHMLPTSMREMLKISLKPYTKDLDIYDAPLSHSWRERVDGVLKWLVPLAHNTMRWQSERNFEQGRMVRRANVLLLETLYFADRERTEAIVCEVIGGLNYVCRFEQQQNALLDCGSSFDFEECVEWQDGDSV